MRNARSIVALCLWLLLCCCLPRGVQAANFGIGITPSADPVAVGGTLTYSVTVTNLVGLDLGNVVITDTLPGSVNLLRVTTTAGVLTTNASTVTATLNLLGAVQVVTLTIVVTPNLAVSIIDSVSVSANNIPPEGTSLVTGVTAPLVPVVSIQSILPTGQVFLGDLLTVHLVATNSGTAAAQDLLISNIFSSGVIFHSLSPTNTGSFFNGNVLVLNLGNLAVGTNSGAFFVIEPTNAAVLSVTNFSFTSNGGTASGNPGFGSTVVLQPALGLISAVPVPDQVFDPQTGLVTQTIRLSNIAATNIPATRVVVGGLTNRLVNAVGTNGGNPFVVFTGALAPGQSADLVLEYFVPARTLIPAPTLTAYPVALPDLTGSTSSPPNISLIVSLASGAKLIEFQSDPGMSYRILYSDNVGFTNPRAAQPILVAPADRVQWIDDGPPKTISRPTNIMRFYRAVLVP